MNKHAAHELLDAAIAGRMVSDADIDEALMATGDLVEDPAATPRQCTSAAGTWERKAPNAGLLAAATWCDV